MKIFLLEDIDAVLNRFNVADEDLDIIMALIKNDPTYKNNNSVGKYGKWLIQQYQKHRLVVPDEFTDYDYQAELIDDVDNPDTFAVRVYVDDTITEQNLTDILTLFENRKSNMRSQDIGQYKTFREFFIELLNTDDVQEDPGAVNRKAAKSEKDCKLVYEDDDWKVYIPETYYASVKLGRGTHWCTATNSSREMYDLYTQFNNSLYVFISKHSDNKYQYSDQSGEFRDKYDVSIKNDFNIIFDLTSNKLVEFMTSIGIYIPYYLTSSVECAIYDEQIESISLLTRQEYSKYYNVFRNAGVRVDYFEDDYEHDLDLDKFSSIESMDLHPVIHLYHESYDEDEPLPMSAILDGVRYLVLDTDLFYHIDGIEFYPDELNNLYAYLNDEVFLSQLGVS